MRVDATDAMSSILSILHSVRTGHRGDGAAPADDPVTAPIGHPHLMGGSTLGGPMVECCGVQGGKVLAQGLLR